MNNALTSLSGLLLGATVGYFLSPKSHWLNDVSITTILTRGIFGGIEIKLFLTGALLTPSILNIYELQAIQTVFNYVLAGALICAFIGYIVTKNTKDEIMEIFKTFSKVPKESIWVQMYEHLNATGL